MNMIEKLCMTMLIVAVISLGYKIAVLEDNQYKFNESVQTLASGLLELREGQR